MIAVDELPAIEELYDLIDSVATYPITARALTDLAIAEGSDRRVIDFYRGFPDDIVFTDDADLISRSEQVQMMSAEEEEQPLEEVRSPQE